jgi:hypothetical protein
MNLAWRNLVRDKTRLVLSAVGVALAIMLILILTGFISGLELQVSRYLDHAPGSVVLVQAGTNGTSSLVPTNTLPDRDRRCRPICPWRGERDSGHIAVRRP